MVLPSGLGYIFPKSHTILHIVEHDFLPFSPNSNNHTPCRAFEFKFRAFNVPTSLTVAELIEQICPVVSPNPPEGNGKRVVSKGIFECIEVGDGRWARGVEFWVGQGEEGGRVGRTLKEIGWDERRGASMAPVWVATRVVYA